MNPATSASMSSMPVAAWIFSNACPYICTFSAATFCASALLAAAPAPVPAVPSRPVPLRAVLLVPRGPLRPCAAMPLLSSSCVSRSRSASSAARTRSRSRLSSSMICVSARHSSSNPCCSRSACAMSAPISATARSLSSWMACAAAIVSAMSRLSLASSRSRLAWMDSNMMRSRRRLLICSRSALLCVMEELYLTAAFSSRFSSSLMRFCTPMLCSLAVLMPPMSERVVVSDSPMNPSCWSSMRVLRISSTILRARLSPSSCKEFIKD
mmetsp:Transcript_26036/g.66223  ORF Transcript_26036/g.66223 Transcript_26036/m.66223 type:complete len:268 (-) Transcript_26036:373-1176(-)